MAKYPAYKRLLSAIEKTSNRLRELKENPNPKKPTGYAQALEETQRRFNALVTEAIQIGKGEKLIVVGLYSKEGNHFVAFYPDLSEDLLHAFIAKDFPSATIDSINVVEYRKAVYKDSE